MAMAPEMAIHCGVIRIVIEGKADQREERGLAQDEFDDVGLGGAQRFQYADLAGALDNGGVHRKEDHQKADRHGNRDHDVDEYGEARQIRRGHERKEILQGTDFIAGEKLFD